MDKTLDWSKEPLQITLGTTSILAGLEHTLPGCHEADSVQVFMTSNLAYGENAINVVFAPDDGAIPHTLLAQMGPKDRFSIVDSFPMEAIPAEAKIDLFTIGCGFFTEMDKKVSTVSHITAIRQWGCRPYRRSPGSRRTYPK